MELYSRIIGHGKPVLILHGLFGMSDNWVTVAGKLSSSCYSIHIPDLRNHGQSPHAANHHYTDMCNDLMEYKTRHGLDNFSLIGHSMGGKLAMIFALLNPELIEKLVIVDIAPVAYDHTISGFHRKLISTLMAIDLKQHTSRRSVKELLLRETGDEELTMFLAKNLTRADGPDKNLAWKLNLPVLQSSLNHLMIGLDDLELHAPCTIPALFLKGDRSDYYLPEHDRQRLHFFSNSTRITVENAGHWLHIDRTDRFVDLVTTFLGALSA